MNRTIIGLASFRAREGGGEQLGQYLRELQLRAQHAVACQGCELLRDPQGEDHWLLRSHWASEEALQAHLALPHMQLLGQLVDNGLIRHMALRIEAGAAEHSAA